MAKSYDGPCPVERVFRVFGGKWKSAILFYLEEKGTLRFNELRKLIPEVTQRMLTQQLRELQRDGLVTRKQYPEIPPRVEYTSTKLASSLEPIFQSIDAWGKKNMAAIHKSRVRYDKQTK
jgi:DNA-binding HxlR family transcriptional regulator